MPGLVYQESGGWAAFAWVLDGLLVLPLLFVFAVLGRRFPTAGGVAGFVGEAFPNLRMGCSYLLVATFALGIPAIALTGAGYLASAIGVASGAGGRWTVAGIAVILVGAVLVMAWMGARFAGSIQNVIVTLLVGSLLLAMVFAIPFWGNIDFAAGDPNWGGVWRGMSLAFFAYTGWEMLAFTAEEFKNPRRDFPIAVATSFTLVLVLYVGVALAIQALVPLDHPLLDTAPFLPVVEAAIGVRYTGAALAVVVLAIIVTNLNGACWAASRLVFDIGRNGWAPKSLGLAGLGGAEAAPRPAIVGLGGMLATVLAGYGAGLWSLADLLGIAGQNFFLLYTFAVVVYVKLATKASARIFGLICLAVCFAFAGVFGWGLVVAVVAFALPYAARKIAGGDPSRRRWPQWNVPALAAVRRPASPTSWRRDDLRAGPIRRDRDGGSGGSRRPNRFYRPAVSTAAVHPASPIDGVALPSITALPMLIVRMDRLLRLVGGYAVKKR